MAKDKKTGKTDIITVRFDEDQLKQLKLLHEAYQSKDFSATIRQAIADVIEHQAIFRRYRLDTMMDTGVMYAMRNPHTEPMALLISKSPLIFTLMEDYETWLKLHNHAWAMAQRLNDGLETEIYVSDNRAATVSGDDNRKAIRELLSPHLEETTKPIEIRFIDDRADYFCIGNHSSVVHSPSLLFPQIGLIFGDSEEGPSSYDLIRSSILQAANTALLARAKGVS